MCFCRPWSRQLALGVCLAARSEPQPTLRVLLGQSRLFTHLLFPNPLAEPLAPIIHPDTPRNAQSQPAASSLQISPGLQRGKQKVTCKHRTRTQTRFSCVFTHRVCTQTFVHAHLHTHMHFWDTCIPLDENPRVENVLINIRELFRAFGLKLHLAVAFQR